MKRAGASDHLAHSFTDLVISLMVIFVLLLVVFLNNQASVSTAVTQSLLADMKRELEPAGLHSIQLDSLDPFTIVVAVPRELMTFEPNSHALKPEATAFLRRKVPDLAKLLCDPRYRRQIESVIVEGYADGSRFRGLDVAESQIRNLRLSQERAMEVVETSLAALSGDDEARTCLLEKLTATARGEQDPEATAAESRRVVLKVRLHSRQATEALEALGRKEQPPTPAPAPATPAVIKVTELLERLRNEDQQHLTFELTEAEINDYLSFTLANMRRPGLEHLAVKIFPHNYVSTLAMVDFDALERWSPSTVPVFLRSLLKGKKTIWVDYRFDVQDGKARFSVEKAFYDQTPLPAMLARRIIQVLAALQPEHIDTEQPIPLPFGIRRIQTGAQVIWGER